MSIGSVSIIIGIVITAFSSALLSQKKDRSERIKNLFEIIGTLGIAMVITGVLCMMYFSYVNS